MILINFLKYLRLGKPLKLEVTLLIFFLSSSDTNNLMRTTTELQDYYESVSNSRIKEIASDKESLSQEAQQILELEIKKRGIIQE